MHEMAIAESLLQLALAEAEKHHCGRLLFLRVECGALSGVMPEALQLCFEALIKGSVHEGTRLEIVEKPLLLRCPLCGARFGGEGQEAIWSPCPECGDGFGHIVEQGKELILSHMEAEPD